MLVAWLSDAAASVALGWCGGAVVRWCPGCGFEGDAVAEVLQFPYVVSHLAVEVDAGLVVAGSEVEEPCSLKLPRSPWQRRQQRGH